MLDSISLDVRHMSLHSLSSAAFQTSRLVKVLSQGHNHGTDAQNLNTQELVSYYVLFHTAMRCCELRLKI